VSWVCCAHHVLCVEHLLGEFRHGECSLLLGSAGGQRCESNHEEVQSRERNEIDCHLSQVRVELARESDAASDTGHSDGDEVVQVTVGRGSELECSEADVVKSFVVDDHDFVGVLDQLVDGEGSVVWFNDGVGHLR